MKKKKCFKCGKVKSLVKFYKHPQMGDGHLNKCIVCAKKDVQERESELRTDPEWYELEKERHREKYYRLGYNEKHKPTPEKQKMAAQLYRERYPEKHRAKNKSQHIESPIGKEKHHWSYNEEHYKDVIFVTKADHNTLHRYMIYDQERMMYRTLLGVLLDTREAHEQYISNKQF